MSIRRERQRQQRASLLKAVHLLSPPLPSPISFKKKERSLSTHNHKRLQGSGPAAEADAANTSRPSRTTLSLSAPPNDVRSELLQYFKRQSLSAQSALGMSSSHLKLEDESFLESESKNSTGAHKSVSQHTKSKHSTSRHSTLSGEKSDSTQPISNKSPRKFNAGVEYFLDQQKKEYGIAKERQRSASAPRSSQRTSRYSSNFDMKQDVPPLTPSIRPVEESLVARSSTPSDVNGGSSHHRRSRRLSITAGKSKSTDYENNDVVSPHGVTSPVTPPRGLRQRLRNARSKEEQKPSSKSRRSRPSQRSRVPQTPTNQIRTPSTTRRGVTPSSRNTKRIVELLQIMPPLYPISPTNVANQNNRQRLRNERSKEDQTPSQRSRVRSQTSTFQIRTPSTSRRSVTPASSRNTERIVELLQITPPLYPVSPSNVANQNNQPQREFSDTLEWQLFSPRARAVLMEGRDERLQKVRQQVQRRRQTMDTLASDSTNGTLIDLSKTLEKVRRWNNRHVPSKREARRRGLLEYENQKLSMSASSFSSRLMSRTFEHNMDILASLCDVENNSRYLEQAKNRHIARRQSENNIPNKSHVIFYREYYYF
jgi:hypothetical protein